jgi:amidohydrolase
MSADAHGAPLPPPRPTVAALVDDAVAVRRELHRHAELSTQEWRTQELIVGRLKAAGLDDVRASADTGATAIVRGAHAGPNLLWRADIDGLPLFEQTGLPFASEAQAMHACAHDGHVAIALAMAAELQRARGSLAGSVRFVFQPAEEHVGGAERMIREGIMAEPGIDRVFGLHIWAALPLGHVGVRAGPIFAAATHFRIIIRGRGGHAAAPHEAVDTIVVAAHAVTALQTVVSRSVDPKETAVLTVGRIEGGVRGNIIPGEVMMSGTIRTYEAAVLERILKQVERVLQGVTSAFGASHQFDHSTLPACVNDPACAAIVSDAAESLVGAERIGEARTTGADDMCRFLEAAPGAYFMLGAAPRGVEHVYPHHHPKFDFDEAALPLGIELGLRIVEQATGSVLT